MYFSKQPEPRRRIGTNVTILLLRLDIKCKRGGICRVLELGEDVVARGNLSLGQRSISDNLLSQPIGSTCLRASRFGECSDVAWTEQMPGHFRS